MLLTASMLRASIVASLLGIASCSSKSNTAEIDAAVDGDGQPLVDSPLASTDAPASTAPSQPGPYTVMKDAATVSGAKLEIYKPAGVPGLIPVVLFKHGFVLATSNYDKLCERIASHGYYVVGVDTGGTIFSSPTNIEERDATVAAVTYVASTLASADPNKIMLAGHSRGGKVSTLVAAIDNRIKALLLLDPVNGCGNGSFSATCPDAVAAAVRSKITVPTGIMGETNNSTGRMPCAPSAQNYTTFFAAYTTAPRTEWTFTGADHMDFTSDGGGLAGAACPDGPGDDAAVRSSVQTLSVAFVRRQLSGDAAMDAFLTGASLPAGTTVRTP